MAAVDPAAPGPFATLALAALAALVTAALIVLLRPLLVRYALARPNARSSHTVPTPQGAGIAIVAAVVALGLGTLALVPMPADRLALVFAASIALAIVGAVDDVRPLPALPRLLMQTAAVLAVVMTMPSDMRALPILPIEGERALLVLAGVWFVNLTNFMDGIDWMTVAQMVPLAAGVLALGFLGEVGAPTLLVAALLLGALVGFAPFNRPVASVFLGDVGSLPIGLLAGWCLVDVAASAGLVAAILLPLYYLVDATLTLFRRMARRERLWVAHRTHFYQIATQRGLSVPQVVARVFAANLALVALAIASAFVGTIATKLAFLAAGFAVVAILLAVLSRGRRS